MTTDSNTPEDPELERWLAKLGGKGEHDDAMTDRLRSTVLKQQQQHEGEIDDLRLRRGRDKLMKKVRKQSSAGLSISRTRPLAIAASVLLAATASLIGYNLFTIAPDTTEIELIMSYGDLERPRGGFSTLTIDADDPLETAQDIGRLLSAARIPFELRRSNDQTLRLAIVVNHTAAVETLREAMGQPGAEISGAGFYVIIFEKKD